MIESVLSIDDLHFDIQYIHIHYHTCTMQNTYNIIHPYEKKYFEERIFRRQ